MPEHSTFDPDWLRNLPVAHRGLHSTGVPENSLAAFAAAVAAGYAIELDVRLTSDRQLIILHDRTTGRLTGTDLVVAETPAAQLTALHLAGTDQTIPLLKEALDLIAGRVPVLIEVKFPVSARHIGPLLLRELRDYRGPVAVAAFDPRVLAWLRRRAPHVVRGQIAGTMPEYSRVPKAARRLLRSMPLNLWTRPHFLSLDVRDYPTRSLRFWSRRLGVPTLLWTVRTAEQARMARGHGHNPIFEDPRVFDINEN